MTQICVILEVPTKAQIIARAIGACSRDDTGAHVIPPSALNTQYSMERATLTHRAHIARLLTPLRRTRPRVPFYELPSHRIPTLWTLFRGLLRASQNEDVNYIHPFVVTCDARDEMS